MTPKCSAEVQSIVHKITDVEIYLTQKTCVLDKVHSDMIYSAVGHVFFNVNEQIIYIKYDVFRDFQMVLVVKNLPMQKM